MSRRSAVTSPPAATAPEPAVPSPSPFRCAGISDEEVLGDGDHRGASSPGRAAESSPSLCSPARNLPDAARVGGGSGGWVGQGVSGLVDGVTYLLERQRPAAGDPHP
ncbi:MAG: hypothetical protein EOO27_07140 [Comamonadaceae bacterium]|nr:MAG: hypothetical protein EOO27_07140 [Comamonadaceae bacterium]